ncbi:MAG: hypothetical protein MHM6MM_007859 [Cercozoa sp. M6MM]
MSSRAARASALLPQRAWEPRVFACFVAALVLTAVMIDVLAAAFGGGMLSHLRVVFFCIVIVVEALALCFFLRTTRTVVRQLAKREAAIEAQGIARFSVFLSSQRICKARRRLERLCALSLFFVPLAILLQLLRLVFHGMELQHHRPPASCNSSHGRFFLCASFFWLQLGCAAALCAVSWIGPRRLARATLPPLSGGSIVSQQPTPRQAPLGGLSTPRLACQESR